MGANPVLDQIHSPNPVDHFVQLIVLGMRGNHGALVMQAVEDGKIALVHLSQLFLVDYLVLDQIERNKSVHHLVIQSIALGIHGNHGEDVMLYVEVEFN